MSHRLPAPVANDGPVIALDQQIMPGVITPIAPIAARRGAVYFGTASAAIADASVQDIRMLARVLRNHPANSIELIGNCDERGGFAYNQRLGIDRAASVAKVLADAGVAPGQIHTSSDGELKPLLRCHEEKCWKMNRRVDLVYGW